MGIPDNLKALRAAANLSQPELARKAGVSQQLISQLENGKNLSTKYLVDIARALGVSIEQIDESYSGLSDASSRKEITEIFDRLKDYPAWQEHLLEQARQLARLAQSQEAAPRPRRKDAAR